MVTTQGEQAELDRLPIEADAFTAQLMEEWAAGDPVRVRWLAALTLRVNGWTYQQIGVALGTDRGAARQRVQRALSSIRGRFVPGDELHEEERGFSNPDRP